MKKIMILLLLLYAAQSVKAQKYRSVLENTSFVQFSQTTIFVDKKAAYNNDDPFYLGTRHGFDSICFQDFQHYDGFTYSRYKSIQHFGFPIDLQMPPSNETYLRHNEDNSKLYVRNGLYPFHEEALIYDISLDNGGTFTARIHGVNMDGVGINSWSIDSALVVDSVYYLEGRKVVQFNYYQKLGPYSQKFCFIEGIGPNFGIFELTIPDYSDYEWSTVLRVYKKTGKVYDFYEGILEEPGVAPYYSLWENTSWGHYVALGLIPSDETVDDPYHSSMEQGPDSLVLQNTSELEGFTLAELKSTLSDQSLFLKQISSCTQVFSSLIDANGSDAQLIYDITLNIGDEFVTPVYRQENTGSWNWQETTLKVDTVYYWTGRKVVEFNFWQPLGPYSQKLKFIEGVGQNFGFYPLNSLSDYSFGCLTSAQFDIWNPTYKFDPYVSVQEDTSFPFEINVCPNPTDGFITLNGLPFSFKGYFAISDLSGHCLQKQPLNGNSINVSDLSGGFYILSLFSEVTQSRSFKFFKN